MPKTALVVMVHGSPRTASNKEMYRVVEAVKTRQAFDIVEVGFMECNEPTIADALDSCVKQGADAVTAVPYFLHTGTHVADDLPTLLDEAQARHPKIPFSMGRYLGASETITDVLADRAAAARRN